MILSFLRQRKRELSHFKALVRSLDSMIGALSLEDPNDYWLAGLRAFQSRAASDCGSSPAEAWNKLAKDIISIYGAMGSFNDNLYPQHLRDLQSALYGAAENVIRSTRRELGGSWVSLPDTQLFRTGQRVALVQGEIIALQRDETPVKAPSSPLVYVVLGRVSNDIDNMPRYHIQSDSHVRYARHNALRSAGAP